jgi:hypothetical protein
MVNVFTIKSGKNTKKKSTESFITYLLFTLNKKNTGQGHGIVNLFLPVIMK